MNLIISFITLIFIASAFPKVNTDTAKVAATVGNYKILFSDYLARYEDYLIWTGLQDNMQARFAILNNMIDEVLLKKYDNNV